MTARQTKRLMWLSGGAACVLGMSVLAWSVLTPIALPEPKADPVGAATGAMDVNGSRPVEIGPTLAELRRVASIDLRRPLRDQPVVVVQRRLVATLAATAYEPGQPERSMALLRLADGSQSWMKAGQTFDDPIGEVTLASIEDGAATVSYEGGERRLQAESP